MFAEFKRRFQNRRQYIDLLWVLVKTSFKMRYQNSVLGVLWVMIKPLTTFLVMYHVWSNLGTGNAIEHFPIYLLTGIVFYTYFQELIVYGQLALLERAHIILKVSFPRQIALIANLLNPLINLFINLIIVFFLIAISGFSVSIVGILYFFFLVITLFIFTTGISFFTSILTIRLRDLKNILELGLFLLFWASPIFYVTSLAPVNSTTIDLINLNPFGHLLNQVRASFGLIYEIDIRFAITFFFVSIVTLLLGWQSFSVRVRKITEYF